MNDFLVNMAIAEHQAAFWETHGGWPAIIHVHPCIIAVLAASPWRVHFDKQAYEERGEGYLAHSRLLPAPQLLVSTMYSPMEQAPAWSGEH